MENQRSYGRMEDEYWTVRKKVGIAKISTVGLLTVTGRDKASFLHGLLTNDIAGLKEHQGVRACLLTPKARIQAYLHVYNDGEKLVLDTGESDPSKLKTVLEQFIITEDVHVQDITGQTTLLSVQGPGSLETVREILRADVSSLTNLMSQQLGPGLIVKRDRTGQSGYDVILPSEEADPVWQGFLLKGVMPIGMDALNVLRLEACIPRFGVDINDNTLVLEAGLKDAISFSKGCYMGQEVVARATFIGHVNKRLAQFTAKTSTPPAAETKLYGDKKEVGTVTSAVYSPVMGSVVGLGYVQKDFAKEGTQVQLMAGQGAVEASITRLA